MRKKKGRGKKGPKWEFDAKDNQTQMYRIYRNINLIDRQTDFSLVEYWRCPIHRGGFSPLNDWPTWVVLDGCLCVSSRLAPWWEIAPTTQLTAPIICQSPARPTRSRWCQFPLRIELSAWLSVIERCIGVWKDDTGPLERLQEGVGAHRNCYLIPAPSCMAWLFRSLSNQKLVERFCILIPPK